MPTYEKRRNADGVVTSIRVKLRRAGQPHLSHTVPVKGDSATALRQAQREAEAWVRRVEAAADIAPAPGGFAGQWHEAMGVAVPASRLSPAPQGLRRAPLNAAQIATAASAAPDRPSAAALQVALHAGLTPDELARLRWQHVRLDARLLDVRTLAGSVSRTIPMSHAAMDALLGLGTRKYGLVFRLSAAHLGAAFNTMCKAAGFSPDAIYRQAAWMLLQQGLEASTVASRMGWPDLSVLESDVGPGGVQWP